MSTPPPTPSITTLTRPWHDFLDISALSLPISFSESTFPWLYLYFLRAEPVLLFNWVFDEWVVLIFLYFVTFVALVLTRVWWNVLVACLIGGVLGCVHGALRAPEDGDDMESPYGPLLSVVDSPRGSYAPVYFVVNHLLRIGRV
ncbi:hypothetical protein POM88_018793 [Heracleum sosnowskyi]|uniref:PRA1 family protein n=1 Tax=Heracleum sosnowskyi TaxID=360622 RepID=A0AAD8MV20_9APIA|nr:hypothetical protein POM88_018793 [Heracleum sosnowskyi]